MTHKTATTLIHELRKKIKALNSPFTKHWEDDDIRTLLDLSADLSDVVLYLLNISGKLEIPTSDALRNRATGDLVKPSERVSFLERLKRRMSV